MNLSMRWLKDYCDLDVTPKEYASRMTMSGSKVEGYEIEGSEISSVVVGKITSVRPHPNADKLVVCMVDVGTGNDVQIVTGAPNVFEGALVPVALHGATLPGGVTITRGDLRGELSDGMMCSVEELGLSDHDFPPNDNSGIMILDESCTVGTDIRTALDFNDTCVEFEITSNRPDCLSVRGLARETAATFGCPLNLPVPVIKNQTDSIDDYLHVTVENKELCTRYTAKVIKNVRIATSPLWMRERLRACGVRPINNLVDITNYVMLEYGHPMHAFDHRYVNDQAIVVRTAKDGESIMTLDGVTRQLTPDMLLICDTKGPIGVAGVMGGEYSGIMDDTTTVVFESACFNGPNIRRTAKKLGLRTDASSRYEKGLDANECYEALMRACQLVEELGAGDVIDGMIDIYDELPRPVSITMDWDWVNEFLGISISPEECRSYLRKLDFVVEGDVVTAPTYRSDIHHKTDVAEEIARLYGYDKIPSTEMKGTANGGLTAHQKFRKKIDETLLGLGLNEIITYSFTSPKSYEKVLLPEDQRESIVISNPLGEDTSVMRVTALPSMLDIIARNIAARNMDGKLYEIATEYIPTQPGKLPKEPQQVMIGLYGSDTDFFTLKGYVESLISRLNLEECRYLPCSDNPSFHPGRTAVLTCGGQEAGILGEIHPQVLKNFKIGTKVYIARISLEVLESHQAPEKTYHQLPKFPALTRDLALVCDEDVLSADLIDLIKNHGGENLVHIGLFDVYTGDQVAPGKKSLAYNLIFRNAQRTLSDEECDKAIADILGALEEKGIVLRS